MRTIGKSSVWIFSAAIACIIISTDCDGDVPNSKFKTLAKKSDLFDKIIDRQKRDVSRKVDNLTNEDTLMKLVYFLIFI